MIGRLPVLSRPQAELLVELLDRRGVMAEIAAEPTVASGVARLREALEKGLGHDPS